MVAEHDGDQAELQCAGPGPVPGLSELLQEQEHSPVTQVGLLSCEKLVKDWKTEHLYQGGAQTNTNTQNCQQTARVPERSPELRAETKHTINLCDQT